MGCVSVSFCLQFQLEIILFGSDFLFYEAKNGIWTWIHWIKCIFVVKSRIFSTHFSILQQSASLFNVHSFFPHFFFFCIKSHVELMCARWIVFVHVHSAQPHRCKIAATLRLSLDNGNGLHLYLLTSDGHIPCTVSLSSGSSWTSVCVPKMPMTVRKHTAARSSWTVEAPIFHYIHDASKSNLFSISLRFSRISIDSSDGKHLAIVDKSNHMDKLLVILEFL